MNTVIMTSQTDIIDVDCILITYLIYFLQITANFPVHLKVPRFVIIYD